MADLDTQSPFDLFSLVKIEGDADAVAGLVELSGGVRGEHHLKIQTEAV